MTTISTTNPHYIRCIKPNNKKEPLLFHKPQVLAQLRCGGVLETVSFIKKGNSGLTLYHRFESAWLDILIEGHIWNFICGIDC